MSLAALAWTVDNLLQLLVGFPLQRTNEPTKSAPDNLYTGLFQPTIALKGI